MKNWLNQNKVFLIGLLQLLITTAITVFGKGGEYDTFLIVYSFAIAVFTYLANNLRGQWASIFSTIINSAVVLGTLHDTHVPLTFPVIMAQIVLPFGFNMLGLFNTSAPKDRNYEKAAPIVEAKQQAKVIAASKK